MYIDPFGVSYSDDKKQLIRCPENFSGNYSIAQGTECIASNAFQNCKDLVKLTIPASVKCIQMNAFKDVTGLSVISFTGTLFQWMQMRHDALINCPHELWINYSHLEEIEVPSDICSIGKNVFFYCKGIKSIKIHNGIKHIEESAFNKSSLAGELTLPEGLETIGDFAFLNCTELKSVEIPASVTKIGDRAFLYCSALTSINVHPENKIYSSVDGVLFNKDKQSLITFPPQHGDFVTPPETRWIANHSFTKVKGAKTITITNPELFSNNAKLAFEGATICNIYIPVGTKTKFINRGFPEKNLKEIFSYSTAIHDGGIRSLINDNPFRTIGVTSNATAKEIASSANKTKRYLEVGKQMQSPLDLNDLLDPISRSPEIMDKAYSSLSLPKDKIRAALFWFYKGDTPEDELAFNLICEGEYQKAIDAYNNMTSLAAWINSAILYFLLDNYPDGLFRIGQIVEDEKFREPFIRGVCGNSVSFSEEELTQCLIDELSTKIHLPHLRILCDEAYTSDIAKAYLKEKTRNSSLGKIENLMRAAKDTRDNDYDGLKKSGLELVDSLADLETIKSIYGAKSAQFEEISDSLSVSIVNTGVRLAKLLEPTDREGFHLVIMDMLIKVLRVPFSEEVKKYCQEQYDAINQVSYRTPHKSFEAQDTIIRAIINEMKKYNGSSISDLIQMVIKCFPQLVEIKKITNDYYLQVTSEDIASIALSKSIPIVNKNRNNAYVVEKAIELLKYLRELPVGDTFRKEQLSKNYSTLIFNPPQGVDVHKIKVKYTVVGNQEELDLWNSCHTRANYEDYIKKYPLGAYVSEAKILIDKIERKKKRISTWTYVILGIILVFVIIGLIWGFETVWGILAFIGIGLIYNLIAPKRRR